MLTMEAFYAAADRAGMLVSCAWSPSNGNPALTAKVSFRSPDQSMLGGMVSSTEYVIKYPDSQLIGLDAGERVTVNSVNYLIRETARISDGTEMMATMTRAA